MNRAPAYIAPSRCVGCGACIEQCPAHAIRMLPGWVAEIDPQTCVGCGQCVSICHRGAPKRIALYANGG